ncbi:Methyltransferase domain-containing protein [Saccharopolyspora flava]|uniref:Methyltransferase domain-containing protein n=1 Tax=Saccharopolyspora flava TaxID=95161 RepID=A0A1I6QS96_9PSEU|nr:Methyltransferase domain-containing protein [Saccharopolyspora flava]
MRATVFTASHVPTYLDECHRTVLAQTHTDWEWVVLLNGTAEWSPPEPDPRIRVLRGTATGHVGAIKREACALATGEVLVELDHDDLLAPTCLAEVVAAFEADPAAVLVYSDFAEINADGSARQERFNPAMGWEYEPVDVDGKPLDRCLALEPSPHNVSYIWYAPNHVRAFRRDAYERVGGYDASLEVLDDQDLMMRLYEIGEFRRIPKCLYLQRMHQGNTQRDQRINRLIQDDTVARYHRGVRRLAIAWAKRSGLAALDLHTRSWTGRAVEPGADELEIDPARPVLPHADDSVGVIVATDLLQRISDRGAFFAECYRVLAHGGLVLTTTPSTDGRGAFQDPTHVSFWNANSFWYLTQAERRDHAFPGNPMRFQVSGIRTYYPTDFDAAHDISYVDANLLAVKSGPRQGGPLLC